MDCLSLTQKALRLFESMENTRTRNESHTSEDYTLVTTMRQRQISTDFCLLIWNFWDLTSVFYNISRVGVIHICL